MADESMPKLNAELQNRKPSAYQERFMRLVEEQNVIRVQKLKLVRRRNNITGLLLGSAVLGIYGYSMYAVRQESFLDDFEEPEKVSN